MRVYHSSSCVIKAPDTLHSRDNLDFGRGFYVTSIRTQAALDALLSHVGHTEVKRD